MIKFISRQIWNLSEYSGIGLGRIAPYIFGLMIGAKSMHKIKKDESKDI